jgi:hypothetical protein
VTALRKNMLRGESSEAGPAPRLLPAIAGPDELCLLLTPRELGGHEGALLGWLTDAVQLHGLGLRIVAPTAALADAVQAAGLGDRLWPAHAAARAPRRALLQVLARWPRGRPLLLAPGVLHADAWLLAAALALGHTVWVYVPMAFSAAEMGYRHAALRDAALAPWLRRVRLWITLDMRQCLWLHQHWAVPAPVQLLPNLPRLVGGGAVPRTPATDGRLRVAFVGRFDAWQKGLDWLAALLQSDPAWQQDHRWHFQGRGDAEPLLQALASALGPQHALVHPHGPIRQALASNDVLLLPSRYEGLPLVALEATQLGWPVVATHQSGLAQLLPPASLFERGDADGLRRALALQRDPLHRRQAVAHAQARLVRLHAPQRLRPALDSLVRHLRAGGQGGSGQPGPGAAAVPHQPA